MTDTNIEKLEKLVNAELTSKIKSSKIEFNELLIETNPDEISEVIQILKTDDKFKFRQLVDIAGVDYPSNNNRFNLIYLLL